MNNPKNITLSQGVPQGAPQGVPQHQSVINSLPNIQTYEVNKIRQLINLNEDEKNVDITFKISSKNGEEFDMIVVDQETLDNDPEIQYNSIKDGMIEGTIKNAQKNFLIILKSSKPCSCDVELIKKRIPPPPPPKPVLQKTEPPKKEGYSIVKICLVVGAVLGIGLLFYFMSQKDKEGSIEKSPQHTYPRFRYIQESPVRSASPVPSRSPIPSVEENPFLERLKNIKLT